MGMLQHHSPCLWRTVWLIPLPGDLSRGIFYWWINDLLDGFGGYGGRLSGYVHRNWADGPA